MAEYLRGDEILACVHRIALTRGAPFAFTPPPLSAELERRQISAHDHRVEVIELLHSSHPNAATPKSRDETMALMGDGCEFILQPRLPNDDTGRRSTSIHGLVRVGRVEERFTYAPLLVKNHEVVEAASTRRTLEGSLAHVRPSEAEFRDGVGTRSTVPMTRSGLSLSHATRVLGSLGHADANARAGIVDRQNRLWWFELANETYPRFNLATYENLYAQRLAVLQGHDEWAAGEAPFPTAPYWHRDCPDCPYAQHCESELEERNDVSLVRFTNFNQQLLLREHGIETRTDLARLDPTRARRARRTLLYPLGAHEREEYLGRTIDKLDDLIYRARAREAGTSLRIVDEASMGCPTADVEVDVDMESYEDATYLWGASVTSNKPLEGVAAGYHAFVEWEPLTRAREAANFAKFWWWLRDVQDQCGAQGLSFAAYCFWAQAEDGAMNRAVASPVKNGPTIADLTTFRTAQPPTWIDLHEQAKQQIQTEGPLGLKQLATAAGFKWRDPNPSGEASILWYVVATSDDHAAAELSRQRLLEYNEDDCRATKSLRDWLNGPARQLGHRDEIA